MPLRDINLLRDARYAAFENVEFCYHPQLVEDLVNTTESYRALKIKVNKNAHEMESWQGKARTSRHIFRNH